MNVTWFRLMLCAALLTLVSSCSRVAMREEILFENPVSDLAGVLTRSGVELDTDVSSDGNGSLKLVAAGPTTFRIFELNDIDVEDARLAYRARLRTEGVRGQAYLEMWCRIPGGGEFFSRALHAPLTGTTEWTSQETPFFLEKGQNPDNVKLNLVIDGSGTVWLDQIVLAKNAR